MARYRARPAQAREALSGWAPYVNERFGFSFRYPSGVFESERSTEAGDGEAFAGVRGDGRLLVGAFENADGHSVVRETLNIPSIMAD